jgi:hypothetical protein
MSKKQSLKKESTQVASTPPPEEKVTPKVVAPKKILAPQPKSHVILKNNMKQMIPVNIRKGNGMTVGIEIPAYTEIIWPNVELGPDVKSKLARKYLSLK